MAIAQMEVLPGRPLDNFEVCLAFLREAADSGADSVIYPAQCFSGLLPTDLGLRSAFRSECLRLGYRLLDEARDVGIKVVFGNYTENGDAAVWVSQEHGVRVHSLKEPGHPWVVVDRIGYALASRAVIQPKGLEGMVLFNDQTCGGHPEHLFRTEDILCPVWFVDRLGLQTSGKGLRGFRGDSWYREPGMHPVVAQVWQQQVLCPWEGQFISADQLMENTGLEEVSPWAGPWERFDSKVFLDLGEMVRRFLDRSKMGKVVVGVSGGIDSSTTAAFFSRLVGPSSVLAVSMPGIYTSDTTRNQARELASRLGCWFAEIPVAESVDWTRQQIQGVAILREGSHSEIRLSDFDFENVTARDRGARVLAAIASGFGGVFAGTGNKAELAVGYCTLYGDQTGFLAPLGDLWKGQVYALAAYLNQVEFCGEVIPHGTFQVHPSAELSSAQNPEKGHGDPLTYWYHDYLLRYWVERHGSPEEVLRAFLADELEGLLGMRKKLQKLFRSPEEFIDDMERWWLAYQGIAVAKRMQAPPVVELSGAPFGAFAPEGAGALYWGSAYQDLRKKALAGKKR